PALRGPPAAGRPKGGLPPSPAPAYDSRPGPARAQGRLVMARTLPRLIVLAAVAVLATAGGTAAQGPPQAPPPPTPVLPAPSTIPPPPPPPPPPPRGLTLPALPLPPLLPPTRPPAPPRAPPLRAPPPAPVPRPDRPRPLPPVRAMGPGLLPAGVVRSSRGRRAGPDVPQRARLVRDGRRRDPAGGRPRRGPGLDRLAADRAGLPPG